MVPPTDIFFLCLDSARYDTFVAAKTPNMSRIGSTRKVYTSACFSQASIFSYFWGYPPMETGKRTLFPNVEKWRWAPKQLSEQGYVTAWLSANPVFLKLDLDGQFRRYFKHFKCVEYDEVKATRQIATDIGDIVEADGGPPRFICSLLLDTHNPYHDGEHTYRLDPHNPEKNFENQVKSIEYVDRCFPHLIKAFNRPTDIIITSDHGDLFGPLVSGYGHDSRMLSLRFHPKLFEVPFITGRIGGE